MTEDLTARLAGLQRAMAAPLPSAEELAAWKAEDRAMAERICKARPGLPLHHAYAVLETLGTLQRVDAAKAEPERDSQRSAVRIAELIGMDPNAALAANAVQDELLPMVHRYRSAWQSARRRAAGLVEADEEAMQDMAGDLYRAEDRLAFVREMCDLADREQRQITTEQVRAWTQYNGCGGAVTLTEQEVEALAADLLAGRVKRRKARIIDAGSYPAKPGRATMAADRCPQCGGDNTDPWALCGNCETAGEQQ